MPLQVPPPDTLDYMIAGYIAFAVIMGIYLASFIIRHRNLEQDLKTLETIQAETKARPASTASVAKVVARSRPPRSAPRRPKTARGRITRKR